MRYIKSLAHSRHSVNGDCYYRQIIQTWFSHTTCCVAAVVPLGQVLIEMSCVLCESRVWFSPSASLIVFQYLTTHAWLALSRWLNQCLWGEGSLSGAD